MTIKFAEATRIMNAMSFMFCRLTPITGFSKEEITQYAEECEKVTREIFSLFCKDEGIDEVEEE